jgi:hypothetical protein
MTTLIVGLVISFLSFVGAILNMATAASKRTVGGLIGGHLGAIIGMALGGVTSFVGLVMIVIDLVNHHG